MRVDAKQSDKGRGSQSSDRRIKGEGIENIRISKRMDRRFGQASARGKKKGRGGWRLVHKLTKMRRKTSQDKNARGAEG